MEIKFRDIYTIKLRTGEEIVTKIVGKTDTAYRIEGVLGIGQGQKGPELMPVMSSIDMAAEGLLSLDVVSMIFPTLVAVQDIYRESLGGVHVPEKKILIG